MKANVSMHAIPVCLATAAPTPAWAAIVPTLAAILPFIAVVLGFWWTRRLQISADKRVRLQRETNARSIVYAQLRRIHATTRQQLAFIDGPDKMIWLTVHRSLFPTEENLVRLEPLAARESDAVTSFYYLYQEQISFLTASAMEVWAPEVRAGMEAKFNLETDVLGFNYSVQGRRDALVKRLINIHRSAEKALAQIRTVIVEQKAELPELHRLVQLEADKLATYV